MKFILIVCLIVSLIATLQAAAVENVNDQSKSSESDETTVAPTEASDVVEECHQPKETGRCFALFYRYAYNVESRQCEEFIYGGCNGNRNNFESKEACEEKCLKKISDADENKEKSTTQAKAHDDALAPMASLADEKPAVVV